VNEDDAHVEIQEIDKEQLIDILTEELPVLRAKIGLSQDDLSDIIGISRQTYSSIETKKRKMSWNVFLSLILMFDNNEKTKGMLEATGAFPENLRNILNIDRRS
jgi:DNA-binding XRE family transcriptional regulator